MPTSTRWRARSVWRPWEVSDFTLFDWEGQIGEGKVFRIPTSYLHMKLVPLKRLFCWRTNREQLSCLTKVRQAHVAIQSYFRGLERSQSKAVSVHLQRGKISASAVGEHC